MSRNDKSIRHLLAGYPRRRLPLPDRQAKIYVEEYKINRGVRGGLLYRLTGTLEAWMHRRIAAETAGGRLLELGAGTLNHLHYERDFRMINVLSDTQVLEGAADFQLLDRAALDSLLRLGDHRPFLRGMVGWLGYRRTMINYVAPARLHGRSSYSWGRMIGLAVDAITAFSSKPLRLAFYTGVAIMAFCIAYLVFIAYSAFNGQVVQGWTSLMAALLLLSAVQLLTIGILGEYIGRIYDQTRNRPRFLTLPDKPGPPSHCGPVPGNQANYDPEKAS